MLFALYMLVASSLFAGRVTPHNAANVAVWVTIAAVERGASMDDARLAATWAVMESAGQADVVSPNGADCGLMQENGPTLQGHSCHEVMRDPVLAVSLWFDMLEMQRARCGSTRAALGAMSTKGLCGGAAKLVRGRCEKAGVQC